MRALHEPSFLVGLMETWVRRPSTPTRLLMDVTRRCNLRCQMCNTWQIEPGHELDPDEIRRVLGALPRLTWLDVTGGEPFLRRDVGEVFEAVLDAAPALRVLHFPTNGWFTERTVAVARRVRERRPEIELIVTVSVDGTREVHDRVRGRVGSYDRALATYRALAAVEGVDTYVGTTITPFNADDVGALGRALLTEIPGFRPSAWHWNWMQISKHFFANEALAPAASATPGASRSAREDLVWAHIERRGVPRNLVDLMELAFLVNLEFFRRGEPSGIVCQALRSTLFLSPEGDVFPCHVYDRPLGNVRDTPIETIWASNEAHAARRDIERLACGGCFTPCEAYPALAGAPVAAVTQTVRRSLRIVGERVRDAALPGRPRG